MGKITWDADNRALSINDKNFILGNIGVTYDCTGTNSKATLTKVNYSTSNSDVAVTQTDIGYIFVGNTIVSPGGSSQFTNIDTGATEFYEIGSEINYYRNDVSIISTSTGYEIIFPEPNFISESHFTSSANSYAIYNHYKASYNAPLSVNNDSVFYFTSPLS